MNNKTAVVVGGAGQIGRSIVNTLQSRGYCVVCISKTDSGSPLMDYVTECLYGDMTKLDQIKRCSDSIFNCYGSVDLLVNVIGKNIKCSLEEISEDIWQEVMDSNLKSVFFLCRTFATNMIKTGGGTIINFSSTAGIKALPQSPHYIAAKAGIIALSEFFAKIYAPKIRVNCIAPGFVLTENHLPENYMNYGDLVKQIPLGQMSSVDEIVEAVLFLISSKTITGHTLVVDGGIIL